MICLYPGREGLYSVIKDLSLKDKSLTLVVGKKEIQLGIEDEDVVVYGIPEVIEDVQSLGKPENLEKVEKVENN